MDKQDFMINFLTNIYDGDEEIYQVFLTNSNVKYADIVKVDKTNMFENFVIYNYSVLLNMPYELIHRIHFKDQSEKANIISEFVQIYNRVTEEKNIVLNQVENDEKVHYITTTLKDLDESGIYLSIFILNNLLNKLQSFVKIPVLDLLIARLVDVVISKINNLTYKYFDSKKPHEFMVIEDHMHRLSKLSTMIFLL